MFVRIALAVVLLDQISKHLLWNFGPQTADILDGFLRITLVKNTGAAFGLFQGARTFFIFASVAASIALVLLYRRVPPFRTYKRVLIACIFGGAVGNLIDRVAWGEVIDFLDMGVGTHRWPVFNVADMAVSVGALLLALVYLREDRSERAESPDPGAGGTQGRTVPDGETRAGGVPEPAPSPPDHGTSSMKANGPP
jgi:signal peptidase II